MLLIVFDFVHDANFVRWTHWITW